MKKEIIELIYDLLKKTLLGGVTGLLLFSLTSIPSASAQESEEDGAELHSAAVSFMKENYGGVDCSSSIQCEPGESCVGYVPVKVKDLPGGGFSVIQDIEGKCRAEGSDGE